MGVLRLRKVAFKNDTSYVVDVPYEMNEIIVQASFDAETTITYKVQGQVQNGDPWTDLKMTKDSDVNMEYVTSASDNSVYVVDVSHYDVIKVVATTSNANDNTLVICSGHMDK